jgi:hypothetical protein
MAGTSGTTTIASPPAVSCTGSSCTRRRTGAHGASRARRATLDARVSGDGARDNTAELIALRHRVRAEAAALVTFEPGHYLYTDERWLAFGDRDVTLDFGGALVECRARPLLPLGGWLSWPPEYPAMPTEATTVKPPGDLIESVEAGATEARLREPVAGSYRADDRVLVAGYIQQLTADGAEGWGWPPNFRYFEYKTVAAVIDERALRFVDPFRYRYDAAWPDYLHDSGASGGRSFGAPRLWRGRTDDGRHVNRSLTIKNARFVGGRDRVAGTFSPFAGRGWHVRFEGCEGDAGTVTWPGLAWRTEYLDCRFGGDRVELDKIGEIVRFERCEFGGRSVTSGGASCLDVSFRDCTFHAPVRATPRRSWRFEGACHFYNGIQLSRGFTKTPFALTGAASAL